MNADVRLDCLRNCSLASIIKYYQMCTFIPVRFCVSAAASSPPRCSTYWQTLNTHFCLCAYFSSSAKCERPGTTSTAFIIDDRPVCNLLYTLSCLPLTSSTLSWSTHTPLQSSHILSTFSPPPHSVALKTLTTRILHSSHPPHLYFFLHVQLCSSTPFSHPSRHALFTVPPPSLFTLSSIPNTTLNTTPALLHLISSSFLTTFHNEFCILLLLSLLHETISNLKNKINQVIT